MSEPARQPLIPDAYAAIVMVAVLLLDFVLPLPLLPPAAWTSPLTGLGILLVLAGACLALSLEWALLGLPLLWLALDRRVVPHEEARLAQGFGDDWTRYAGATRRWF